MKTVKSILVSKGDGQFVKTEVKKLKTREKTATTQL